MCRVVSNTWDMNLEQFISQHKAVRFPQRTQFTAQFSRSRQVGCHYYIYIEIDTLKCINPFTKKDKGKKYKSFFSSISAEHSKELAYNYIQEVIKEY